MIGVVMTMMAWNNVAIAADIPIQYNSPRTREEVIEARKDRLRSRFEKVESQFEKKSVEELNREFFLNLVKPKEVESEEMKVDSVEPQDILVSAFDYEPQNILVVAPHPDDEILCCATTISDHLAAGDHVSIVVVTDGDGKECGNAPESLAYGRERREESLAAAKELGIAAEDVMFLGFPDGHLDELEKKHRARSSFTQLMSTLKTSLFPGTPYTWGGLQDVLRKVLTEVEPDMIYIPGDHDTHPDHRAAGHAVKRAAKIMELTPVWSEYSVHFKKNKAANLPQNKEKMSLIRLFQSQRHDLAHVQYLEEFAYRKETFLKSYKTTSLEK